MTPQWTASLCCVLFVKVTAKIGTGGRNLEIRFAVLPPCVKATIALIFSNVKAESLTEIPIASWMVF
ncbi:hypothetical protein SDC9_119291 [bioreactor metagenome]|uniref:Uncharacterized protein n=1 Tax=bioreactor metagenome TaxID=1076179 RepID=A0A645C4L3_9ZZZZ